MQAQRSFNSIVQAFKPLETSIYKEKIVIYADQQASANQRDTFLKAYPHLQTNGQFLESTMPSIEEYYPSPWQKSVSDVKTMSGDDKLALAKAVGDAISKDDFEKQMPVFYEALKKCWTLTFE